MRLGGCLTKRDESSGEKGGVCGLRDVVKERRSIRVWGGYLGFLLSHMKDGK